MLAFVTAVGAVCWLLLVALYVISARADAAQSSDQARRHLELEGVRAVRSLPSRDRQRDPDPARPLQPT